MIGGKVRIDTRGITAMLSEAKSRRVTLVGVRAGIRVLQTAARSAAPRRVRSGALRQAQGVLAKKGRRGTTVSFAVQGARKRVVKMIKLKGYKTPQKVVPANYDHLVLGGTRPHRLGKGELLQRLTGRRKTKGTSQTTGGKHPGTQPNPYRKRAWNSVKDQVGEVTRAAMKAELQKIIAKEAAKMKRK